MLFSSRCIQCIYHIYFRALCWTLSEDHKSFQINISLESVLPWRRLVVRTNRPKTLVCFWFLDPRRSRKVLWNECCQSVRNHRVATGPRKPRMTSNLKGWPWKPRICLIFWQMTLNDLEKYFLPYETKMEVTSSEEQFQFSIFIPILITIFVYCSQSSNNRINHIFTPRSY